MDATGAGTSTGQRAAPPDVTGSAEDVTAGPVQPVGRADATGPLPVQAPADPTGPLPAQEPGSWFATGTDTAAQPVVPTGPPPSWFATGPLPVIPGEPEAAGVVPAEQTLPPAPAPPPVAADLFAPSGTATPPGGLFQPVNGHAAPAAAGTAPLPVVPPPVDPSPADDGFASPPPPTGPMPVVPPPPPPGSGDPLPPGLAVPEPPPASAAVSPPAADLFTPATPPSAQSDGVGVPPPDLFAPATPAAPEPPAAPIPDSPIPGDPPVHPMDATGPMPVIGVQGSPAAVAPPPAPPAAEIVPPPVPELPPRTDSWAFQPEPARPAVPVPPAPPSDDRKRRSARPWVLPTQAGGGHSPSLTMVSGSNAAGRQAKRRAWPLTVVGVLVAVAAGIALVFSVARTNPADLAATAAADAGSWPGVRYQGVVAANDGGQIRFDLTVTPQGAAGTLSRDGGRATAELLWDQGGALIRANQVWWLYHHPTRADDLADAWVAEPHTETQEIAPVLHLVGPALSAYVRGEPSTRWQATEQQLVEGRSGIVLFDGARRAVVGSEDSHPLLAVDVAPDAKTPPVPVIRATDEEIAAVTGAAARVRLEAAPKTLDQLLLERPNVGIQLQPDPLCTAQTCNVTVTVTNSGTAPARGYLEVSADGNVVAKHPLDVQPGQVATFTATAPNPQFAQPGAASRILWTTRAVDD